MILRKLVNRKKYDEIHDEIGFYKDVFKGDLFDQLVFDVGANVGAKTEIFKLLNAKKIICFEPDEFNHDYLTNYFNIESIVIDKRGVSDITGEAKLLTHESGSGFNTLSEKWKQVLSDKKLNRWSESHNFKGHQHINTIRLEDAIALYGIPFYIKIDVEGHEINVVKGLNQKIKFISVECNLPEFLDESIEIIEKLNSINCDAKFNYCNSTRLILNDDVNHKEMIEIIKNTTLKYLELYCFN